MRHVKLGRQKQKTCFHRSYAYLHPCLGMTRLLLPKEPGNLSRGAALSAPEASDCQP